jgi:hypothetical protein
VTGGDGFDSRSQPVAADWLHALLATALTGAALWATVHLGWWQQPVWGKRGALNFALVLLVLAPPLLWAPSRSLPALGAIGAVVIAWLSVSFAALAGAAAVLFCAYVAGRKLQLRLGIADGDAAPGAMDVLVALAAGFALVALVVNGLVFLPINGTLLYVAAVLATLVLGVDRLRELPALVARLAFAPPGDRPWLSSLPLRAAMLLVWLHLLVVGFPEMGHDALAMHLAIPHVIAAEGRWSFDVTRFIWAVMPMNADWLYTAAWFLGGEAAARLFNVVTLLLTAAIIYVWSRERLGTAAASFAALLWLSLPLSFLESASAFIELPLTFVCAAMLVVATDAFRHGRLGHWLLAAALFGSAVASKLPALLLAPGLLLVGAAQYVALRRDSTGPWWRQRSARDLLLGLALAAAVATFFAAPPYLNAWLRTGNPVFPFFNALFRSPYFETAASFTNPLFVHPIGWTSFIDLSLRSSRFLESPGDGALGIALLVLVPLSTLAALARRDVHILVLLAVALLFCLLVFREQVYLRYIVPVVPLLCIASAYALAQVRPAPLAAATGAALLVLNLARLPSAHWPLSSFPLQTLLSEAERDRQLVAMHPEQVAAGVLQRLLQGTGRTAAMFGVDPVIARAPARTVTDSWHSHPVVRAAQVGGAEGLLAALVARGVEFFVVPRHTDAAHLQRLLAVSSEVAGVGRLQIRRIDLDRLPLRQALADPDLRQAPAHWGIAPERVDERGRGVWVTVDAPAHQRVDLAGVTMMAVENRFYCPQPTDVRSQVNWHAADGRFMATTIEVARCAGELVLRRRVDPPPGAASAEVFASPHATQAVLAARASAEVPLVEAPR